jgi:hypothetical protein
MADPKRTWCEKCDRSISEYVQHGCPIRERIARLEKAAKEAIENITLHKWTIAQSILITALQSSQETSAAQASKDSSDAK